MIANPAQIESEQIFGKPAGDRWQGPHFRPIGLGVHCHRRGHPLATDDLALSAIEQQFSWRLTLRGQAWLEIGERRWLIEPGTVFASALPRNARIVPRRDSLPWEYLYVNLCGRRALDACQWLVKEFGMLQRLSLDGGLVESTQVLITGLSSSPAWDEHRWSEETYRWFHTWWREAEKQTGSRMILDDEPSSSRLIGLSCGTVKEFAARLGYSPSHLSRKVSAMWNKTPGRALRRARLDEAARLLVAEDLSVEEISRVVGYSSSGSLVRAFRREFGVSPLVYRHTHR
ncbi:helix-turn-helix transcriptional regulator [Nibricoccus sp. IMCC34717]|uniref:helix-turn-helix transcriptional regulator n=1 Tax=Nibricoccus sp. IMCC34717 TaxID=3034021 RepID=UPI00384B2DF2